MSLTAVNIYKTFHDTGVPVAVLADLNFKCEEGELIGIHGASGTGKSTLLHILGGLDEPDSGEVRFDGRDVYRQSDGELSSLRNKEIGFVFQFFHLMAEFSALENVMLPALIGGVSSKKAREMALSALSLVDLADRASHRPAALSGGEQQRVAIARACIMSPRLILADEPTGNLDKENGEKVFHYLMELHKRVATTMVIVSHNMELIKKLNRSYVLENGKLT